MDLAYKFAQRIFDNRQVGVERHDDRIVTHNSGIGQPQFLA
jgi:hypothetical protein